MERVKDFLRKHQVLLVVFFLAVVFMHTSYPKYHFHFAKGGGRLFRSNKITGKVEYNYFAQKEWKNMSKSLLEAAKDNLNERWTVFVYNCEIMLRNLSENIRRTFKRNSKKVYYHQESRGVGLIDDAGIFNEKNKEDVSRALVDDLGLLDKRIGGNKLNLIDDDQILTAE